jgi:predicted nucleic acid-binding protein
MRIQRCEVTYVALVDLALETGLSIYDASYLHVARGCGLPLVTFDQRLRDAAEAF